MTTSSPANYGEGEAFAQIAINTAIAVARTYLQPRYSVAQVNQFLDVDGGYAFPEEALSQNVLRYAYFELFRNQPADEDHPARRAKEDALMYFRAVRDGRQAIGVETGDSPDPEQESFYPEGKGAYADLGRPPRRARSAPPQADSGGGGGGDDATALELARAAKSEADRAFTLANTNHTLLLNIQQIVNQILADGTGNGRTLAEIQTIIADYLAANNYEDSDELAQQIATALAPYATDAQLQAVKTALQGMIDANTQNITNNAAALVRHAADINTISGDLAALTFVKTITRVDNNLRVVNRDDSVQVIPLPASGGSGGGGETAAGVELLRTFGPYNAAALLAMAVGAKTARDAGQVGAQGIWIVGLDQSAGEGVPVALTLEDRTGGRAPAVTNGEFLFKAGSILQSVYVDDANFTLALLSVPADANAAMRTPAQLDAAMFGDNGRAVVSAPAAGEAQALNLRIPGPGFAEATRLEFTIGLSAEDITAIGNGNDLRLSFDLAAAEGEAEGNITPEIEIQIGTDADARTLSAHSAR